MIPNFTSLEEALAQTSPDGPDDRRRADALVGNELVAQHGLSELDGETCDRDAAAV
jgi:hypothetical protein